MYLNAHTYFSLRWGTLSPQRLVEEAKKMGLHTLALTDINNTSCSYQFVKACEGHQIKPVLGIEFRHNKKLLYIGIARNNEGWHALCQLLTQSSLENIPLTACAPPMEHVFIIYEQAPKPLSELASNEFIGIRPHQAHTLYSSALKNHMDKLVILSPITFLDEADYKTHKLLRAIDLNTLVTKLCPSDYAKQNEIPVHPQQLAETFALYPAIIENTNRLLSYCSIDIKSELENNRQTFTGSKAGDFSLLEKLTARGLKKRYGEKHSQAYERVAKELKVIRQLDFCCYFLVTWDILRYATSQGYYYVGRGSGGNSIVAYCLYITNVEPLELDLYFERFINEFRSSPPDFDIDFSWDERDDVTDYIFKRYGTAHTALLATYSTFKHKAAVREIAKALGLAKSDIDQIIREPLASHKHHHWAKHIFKFAAVIQGLPNHLSIHAGGIIISEKPLNYFTALKLMPKGFPVAHFDMYGAEALQFHKYDVLSQRGLGHIKDAVALVKSNQGRAIDIHNIEAIKKDAKVQAQLAAATCIGCFYIESPAMRGLLTKLSCSSYVHLVAASSIIRPGVAKSGMMREYIKRFHNPAEVEYLHPVFASHLKETFGVMVYQEDVLKILYHFAGITLAEADIIRRLMKGWKNNSGQLLELEIRYFKNCSERGYPEELATEVWRQIRSFSGYSFCKAHSASFAAESFQSLYLKTYYPIEFMVGVINNFGGFYRTEYYFHEARMSGAMIHPPCVNNSLYLTTVKGKEIYTGFIHLHQCQRRVAQQIVDNRVRSGDFSSLEDFTKRIEISGEQLDILIRIEAFRFTGKNKYELMWEKNRVHNVRQRLTHTAYLFCNDAKTVSLPILEEGKYDNAFDQIELLGFPLCSPFDLLSSTVKNDTLARQLKKHVHQIIQIVGYYVCRKDVTTVKKKHMYFGTWLDKEGAYFDSIHFTTALEKYPFKGKGCYLLTGKVVLDFEFPSIEVIRMEKLPFVQDERY